MKRRYLADFAGTNRFEILRCIGAGGMGTVYEAFDKERNARVALKTLRAMDGESLLLFKKEFRDFQDLSHPNLVSVGELFADEGDWFFTMELIDGVNFLEYVRPGTFAQRDVSSEDLAPTAIGLARESSSPRVYPPRHWSSGILNEARLRIGLRQLALGLQALHDAAKVHRDIKPSNMLVTQQGRVVLLDFGLAVEFEGREHQSEIDIVGTVEYMAPEQAAARQVGPPADWYAVGVILYEALTGQVPLSGPALEVLMNKQKLDAPSPRAVNPAAPEDLSRLTADLLRFNPSARPSGKQVLERLGAEGSQSSTPSLSSFSTSSNFVGRAPELSLLAERFERARRVAQTVCVHGESGLGKSALVRHFVEQLKTREPGVVVLAGACYERESVPFKAVDGLVDALSQYMRRLPKAEAAALLPRRASLLAQVFPVLQRVEAVAEAPRAAEEVLDPQELRSRLFAALRELLERLTDRHPLVLVIDDLQWADADSLALLGELMRPPEAPCLLLIATVRSDDVALALTRQQWLSEHLRSEIEHLTLQRMSPEESRELAETLVRRAPGQAALNAVAIAQEAGGHPLFIDELIRHAVAVGSPTPSALQLEDVLWSRLSQLDPDARRVLEIVALASGRLSQYTAAQAAALPFGDFAKHVALLRVAHFMRTTGMRQSDSVEPYHDRVRKAVLGHLDATTMRHHHRRLALALETSGHADPEALTIHWREAGDNAKAAHFAQSAADKAAKALAFDRAAHFYHVCIELLDPSPPRETRVRLADALANAGRGKDSGEAFLLAADCTTDKAEALDLRRRAAGQFLRSGHVDKGLEVLEVVLRAVGMKLPNGRSFASLLFRRAILRTRGLGFRERAEKDVPRAELQRVDICWAAAEGMALLDTFTGSEFITRASVLALKCGEPQRVARALAMETAYTATVGYRPRSRASRLAKMTLELAQRSGQPHGIGLAHWAAGTAACLEGRWREGLQVSAEAEAIFRDQCVGATWELESSRFFLLWCTFYTGEIADLLKRIPLYRREAEARGDLYGLTNLHVCFGHFGELAKDHIDAARREPDIGLASWSHRGVFLQHINAVCARAETELYAGDGAAAYDILIRAWEEIERTLFLKLVQFPRVRMLNVRGAAALASGRLAEAMQDASRLERESATWARAHGLLLRAGVRRVDHPEEGIALLRKAVDALEAAELRLYSASAKRQLGRLLGAGEGAALVTAADNWMSEKGIRNPARMADMLAPGLVPAT